MMSLRLPRSAPSDRSSILPCHMASFPVVPPWLPPMCAPPRIATTPHTTPHNSTQRPDTTVFSFVCDPP